MRAASVLVLLCGIVCDGKEMGTRVVTPRQNEEPVSEATSLDQEIQAVISQLHSLSGEKANHRSFSISSPPDGVDLNAYYNVLNNVLTVFQPLLKQNYLDSLPTTLVCILSGREDCGLDAELTKTVSEELVKPLLTLMSSARSQTCSSEAEAGSFLTAYLRAGRSVAATVIGGFQEKFQSILSSLPVSGNFMASVSNMVDAAVACMSEFVVVLLSVPMDYIKIVLQFGIRIPSLEGKETCHQGDLKQLIMWGIKHNVSWSFSHSLIDILLETLLPSEQTLCAYPGPNCPNPFQRGAVEADNSHYNLLRCNRKDLATFNDTVCAEILSGSTHGASNSVLTLCQALGTLGPQQIERVWSNMCYGVLALASPLLSRSSDCNTADAPPIPLSQPAPHRSAREASNLQQLACNYNSWLEEQMVDSVLVSLCSDNERTVFVTQVCQNGTLMKKLLADQTNSWLYGYCSNSTADPWYMVAQLCVYEQWLNQPTGLVTTPLLEFCMSLDSGRLTQLICEHTGFFMLIFSNPENIRFLPNCTNVPFPPPMPGLGSFIPDSCQYSEWHDVIQITTDVLSHCIRNDPQGFSDAVCSNQTFLDELLRRREHSWLVDHCNTALTFPPTAAAPTKKPPTDTPQPFVITAWCDYHTWAERQVDDSVVGLCWQYDQLAFQKNVCCDESVFKKLLQNPQNKWLLSVCTDIKEIDSDNEVLPQVCRYSEWTHPIIVDMTELALCAEIDPNNFTSKVCANATVLQNLLANQDNTWLIEHCANTTDMGVSSGGDGAQGGVVNGFHPAEQCQYSSWSISLPDVALLTLCWEHDQANFISSVCPNPMLLLLLAHEPTSMWVAPMCTTYTNYTPTTSNNHNNTVDGDFCLAKQLVKLLNWSCSADFRAACQPGASHNMALQILLRCWVESLRARVEHLVTPTVAAAWKQATSTAVVVLLALEEVRNTSLHVTENIRLSVLVSVVRYLEREDNFEKKRVLLQCFGRVLTSLMQTARDVTSDEFFVIKEYFFIPLHSLQPVLRAAHITTVRLILQYYSREKHTLQLSDEYLTVMVSVMFHTHLVNDGSLFPELAPLLEAASPADIQALPPLQNNLLVRETINRYIGHMSPEQQRAFGLWYSKAMPPSDIIGGQQSLIRDTGNVIAYLPFHNFQYLSPAQLLDGLDVLQRNDLTPLKQEFIAQSIIGTYKNMTAQDFIRLGDLVCLADPQDLHAYEGTEAFTAIQDIIMNCTRDGRSLPSQLTSSLLLNNEELQVPSSLGPEQLADLAHLLPSLGVTFLEDLTPLQLVAILPSLESVSFSPEQALLGLASWQLVVLGGPDEQLTSSRHTDLSAAQLSSRQHTSGKMFESFTQTVPVKQLGESLFTSMLIDFLSSLQASVIVNKLSSSDTVRLQEFGSLIGGMKTETLLMLTSDRLLESLPDMAQHIRLCSPQANAISTKLWGFPEVFTWLDEVEPLLVCTPLLSVQPRTHLLVHNATDTFSKHWNTQQAKAIFKELLDFQSNLITEDFLKLGTVGQGMSCEVLQERFRADPSPSPVRGILALLRHQPTPLHTSLKKCVIDEVYKFEFFAELLEDLGTEIALSMPVSTIKKFPTDMMDTLRKMIIEAPTQFLIQSRTKQDLLVDKIVQRMSMYTGVFTEEEFRSLGIMATFVVDEVLIQMDRKFFADNLDYLWGLCYTSSKMDIMARILQDTFGSVGDWNQATLSQVDRFLLFLPEDTLQRISMDLMTVARIEKLFMSQHRWERGEVGRHCLKQDERQRFSEKQRFLLQFFLGFLKIHPQSPTPMVPTCEILHTTAPFAWTSNSLTSMSPSAFKNCLELIGHDPFLASYQRSQVLKKVKELYGPVSSFSQSVITQLGGLAIEFSPEELNNLQLTERGSIATMGAISTWSERQLATLFIRVLNSTKQSPSQLDSSSLVSLGHIVCGAKSTDMSSFNAVEFSKAVLCLGQLRLSCSEEQLLALVGLLTHSLAFGPISSWGTDVFIEIGILAAGLPDMAMSALVKHQIEGITPLAISMIPPDKFAVVFHQQQIGMLSYDQAAAVTELQLYAMSDDQRMALAMVLTPWEDRPIDFRGRSLGLALNHTPLCLILGLLMLLIVVPNSDLICPGS